MPDRKIEIDDSLRFELNGAIRAAFQAAGFDAHFLLIFAVRPIELVEGEEPPSAVDFISTTDEEGTKQMLEIGLKMADGPMKYVKPS